MNQRPAPIGAFNQLRTLRIFFLLGLALLYAGLIALFSKPNIKYDASQYFAYAKGLLLSNVYGTNPGIPDAGREPGYGFFLSLLMRITTLTDQLHGVSDRVLEDSLKAFVFLQSLFAFFCYSSVFKISFLTPRQKNWFIFLLLLSPSVINANCVLFSETLAISLFVLFLTTLSLAFERRNPLYTLISALLWGSLILTKTYLQYSVALFFVLAVFYFIRSHRKYGWIFISIALLSSTFPYFWEQRTKRYHLEAEVGFRKILVTSGKVLKVDSLKFPEDVPIALLSAVGTNTCQKIYGEKPCSRFDYRGADKLAIDAIGEYSKTYKTQDELESAFRKEILQRWKKRPLVQLFGCFLEGLRMLFVESADTFLLYPFPLNFFAPFWHFVGSLLVWGFAISGLLSINRQNKTDSLPPSLKPMLLFGLGFLLYHYALMMQVSTLARYTYLSLPIFYLFIVFAPNVKFDFYSGK